mgnify:FL=1
MKKIIIAFMLFTSPSFSNDYKWAKDELLTLQKNYTLYISSIVKASNNLEQIIKLDSDLSIQQATSSTVLLSGNKSFEIYPLEFFTRVNPLGDYHPTNMTVQDKQYLAEIDRAKINVSLFMLTNLEVLYSQLVKKPESNTIYKDFFKKSQEYLLSLAKKALTVPREEAEMLSTEFNLFILKLSEVPFPSIYSFYRRRMLYSLDTPEAAQNEINRINQSILEIK